MKQTALQELISEMEQLRNLKQLMPSITAIEQCIELALSKLEMEKKQIIEASEEGNDWDNAIVIDGEEYYNETFKSK